MNKIYFDAVKNLEVYDVSGQKTLEQLKKDFNAPGLVDVTVEREAAAAASKAAAEAKALIEAPREKLIADKIRELAVAELIKAGKLDAAGNLI